MSRIDSAFRSLRRLSTVSVALTMILAPPGCSQQQRAGGLRRENLPDYSRPIAPGENALRRITDPERMPDIAKAYRDRDPRLGDAVASSENWFHAPSSRQHFPLMGFTHDQAHASVIAFAELLEAAPDEANFIDEFHRRFDVYESVGYNGEGVVLFTGYFSPIFRASYTPTEKFSTPLYRRPADLVTEPITGTPRGRQRADGGVEPYPTRQEIESSGMLAGQELVWLEDSLSAYLVHVNGSAKLRMTDGTTAYIGYAGKTDRDYASLGQAMIQDGLLEEDEVSLSTIRRVFRHQPKSVERLMAHNENYVFFTEMSENIWPAGSLGVPVTSRRSLATDKKIYPRGGLVLVDTDTFSYASQRRPFTQFMLDQDTGGAIRAPGRADIFMGIGAGAEIIAGGQYAEGRLYYMFVKPEYVSMYLNDDSSRPNASMRTRVDG